TAKLNIAESDNELFAEGIAYRFNQKLLMEMGRVANPLLKKFEVDKPVFYASLKWEEIISQQTKHKIEFEELPKFPAVRRDLALVIDQNIIFKQIEDIAFRTERKILRNVGLFDLYKEKGIAEGKKSYAVNFILRDDLRTLND